MGFLAGRVFQNQLKTIFVRFKRVSYVRFLPDLFIIVGSVYLSLFLRVGSREFQDYVWLLNRHLGIVVLFRCGTCVSLGIYDIIWRYVSVNDVLRIVKAIVLSSLMIVTASYVINLDGLPSTLFLIDTLLVATLLLGIRFGRRLVHQSSLKKRAKEIGRRALIFGAGISGRALATRLTTDGSLGYNLLGFIDDDPEKVGRTVAGERVLGTRKDLCQIINNFEIKEVFVAISKPDPDILREIVQVCEATGIQPKIVASLPQGKSNAVHVSRNIGLNELLNRPTHEVRSLPLYELLHKKRVLVTGAGGSIGSELARQIIPYNPSILLLIDHSESHLYQIDQELDEGHSENSRVISLLADIKDKLSLRSLFKEYAPEIIFHAAAYKHVHLVESNPLLSILNNILGTRNLLDLCNEFDVGTFVLISTDKAVNPAGVMGATKRVCELLVTCEGERTGKRFCSVRFGNVLGSSGSLIPLLKNQIENGEPITITHKDMARYFMLIQEAISLVLKAASIAQPGDIRILRMGQPIKIVDIAKSLIALMGKREEDVPITFTGIRPGEKLCEELYLCGNELKAEDSDIWVLPQGDKSVVEGYAKDFLQASVDRIIQLAQQSNKDAICLMNSLVKMNQPESAEAYRQPLEEPSDTNVENVTYYFKSKPSPAQETDRVR